jgi:hypothetical protein
MGKANLFLAFILALVIGFVGYATFFLKASPKTMPAHAVQAVKPIRRQVPIGDHVALVRIQETLNRQSIEIKRQRMALAHVRAELNRRSAALATDVATDLATDLATQSKAIARQRVILAKQSAALKRHQSEIAKLQKEMDHKVSF